MAADFDDDDEDLWELAEDVDLFSLIRRASPLTDLGFWVLCTILRFWCFVYNMVSMTVKLVLSSIDMNIHVCAKLTGHDVM